MDPMAKRNLEQNQPVNLTVEETGSSIEATNYDGVLRAQRLVSRYVPATGRFLSEELVEDRRREAAEE